MDLCVPGSWSLGHDYDIKDINIMDYIPHYRAFLSVYRECEEKVKEFDRLISAAEADRKFKLAENMSIRRSRFICRLNRTRVNHYDIKECKTLLYEINDWLSLLENCSW